MSTGSWPRPAPRPPLAAGPVPPPLPPAGFTVDVAPPSDLGAALVGRQLLYWWPDEGWQLGRVRRRSRKAPFTHAGRGVVGYRFPSAAFTGEVDSLLDEASYGSRWVALVPHASLGRFKSGTALPSESEYSE